MRQLPRNSHGRQHGTGKAPSSWWLTPAYCVLPLLRVPLGYSLVTPFAAIVRTLAIAVLPVLWWALYMAVTNSEPPANAGHRWLMGFAVLCLAANLFVFAQRSIGWRRGEGILTQEAGYSWLAWHTELPLPLTEQLIIPASFAGAGWVIAHSFSLELGWWLILCGMSLLLMATWERRLYRNAILTTQDGMIQAQTSGWRVEQQEAKAKGRGGPASVDAPAFAETGNGPAAGPDAMSFGKDSDGITPDRMTWFRKRRATGAAGRPEVAAVAVNSTGRLALMLLWAARPAWQKQIR